MVYRSHSASFCVCVFIKNIYNDDIIDINVLREGNVFLMMHSTYFIYGYMALDIW